MLLLLVVVMVPLYTMPVARQLPFMGQFVGFWQLHVFFVVGGGLVGCVSGVRGGGGVLGFEEFFVVC